MKIGGLIKSSMIDYPGKISCVLFTCGCNFVCPYCHNKELIKHVKEGDSTGFDVEEIFKFLEKRKGLLDGVVITGGEPTLQKKLFPVCEKIKNAGYPIKLDTNGSNPGIVKELIDANLVDYLAMDIKAIPSFYSPIIIKKNIMDAILKSIEMIMNSNLMYEFRTTCARPFVNNDMIRQVSEIIKGARLFALQTFNPENVLAPDFFKKQGEVYNDEEMEAFRTIAGEYVESCIIR